MEKIEGIGREVERDKDLYLACYKTQEGWLVGGVFFYTKEDAFVYGDNLKAEKVVVVAVDIKLFLP